VDGSLILDETQIPTGGRPALTQLALILLLFCSESPLRRWQRRLERPVGTWLQQNNPLLGVSLPLNHAENGLADLIYVEISGSRKSLVIRQLGQEMSAEQAHPRVVLPAKPSSSIERLLDELMAEIFLSCLPDYVEYQQSPLMLRAYQAQDAPLLLCGVCRS
jgi:hypothetical protein